MKPIVPRGRFLRRGSARFFFIPKVSEADLPPGPWAMANQAESDFLKLFFQNLAMSGVGDATGIPGSAVAGSLYISLHTANPTESGSQASSEANYPGYARVGVARSSVGWIISATAPTQVVNAANIEFGACTSGGNTVSYFGLGTSSTGAGKLSFYGALTSPLVVTPGKAPVFQAGQLKFTLD